MSRLRTGLVVVLLSGALSAIAARPAAAYFYPNPTEETGVAGIYLYGVVDSIALGDFNGDARPDAVVVTTVNKVTPPAIRLIFYPGIGDGSFGPASVLQAEQDPIRVSATDINRDGKLDLVTISKGFNPPGNVIGVYRGNGDGTFLRPAFQGGFTAPALEIAPADLDGDGWIDVTAITSDNKLCRLMNGGAPGLLAPASCLPTTPGIALALADFNEDGHPDAAVAGSLGLVVHLSNATGTGFMAPTPLVENASIPAVSGADYNRDGHVDLSYMSDPSAGGQTTLRVLLGDGLGGFAGAGAYPASSCCTGLAAADVDGDGLLDLVTAGTWETGRGGFSVLPGMGDGSFSAPRLFSEGTGVRVMVLGDLDRDGSIDVLAGVGRATGTTPGGMTSFLGTADETFSQARLGEGAGSRIEAGDLDADGRADLVIAEQLNDRISVLRSRGDGTFDPPMRFACGSSPRGLALADFDGDGHLDVATGLSNGLSLLFGRGDGTFDPAVLLAGGENHTSVAAGDFNGDGIVDLATDNSTASDVSVFPGIGGGAFAAPLRFPAGLHPGHLVAADMDSDGHLDLVLASIGGVLPTATFLYGRGDGTFDPPSYLSSSGSPTAIHIVDLLVADFDVDSRPDLAVANDALGVVHIYRGAGQRFFQNISTIGVDGPVGLAAADLDGDADADLLASSRTSSDLEVSLWVGTHFGYFANPMRFGTATGADLVGGDFNSDGAADAALATAEGLASVILQRTGASPSQHDPVADAGGNRTVECAPAWGTPVTLDGSASSDGDSTPGTNDDIVQFTWFEHYGEPAQVLLGTGETFMTSLTLGLHPITLRVVDGTGRTSANTATITVADTLPPDVTIEPDTTLLWPPNHRMVAVFSRVIVADQCGGPASFALEGVSSSEPDDAPGGADGMTTGDIADIFVGETYVQFSLRAERSRLGNGRTYTARYVVADTSGHAKTVLSLVTVPHDLNGVTDPLTIRLSETSSGTRVDWDPVPGAACYDVAVGDLATLRGFNSGAGLEIAACAGSQILQPEIEIDLGTPVPGSGYYFMVDYVTAAGQRSGYGSESGPFDLEPILPRLLCP